MEKGTGTIGSPEDCAALRIDTTMEAVRTLIDRLLTDRSYRVTFNSAPAKILSEIGIELAPSVVSKLEASPITRLIKGQVAGNNAAVLW
jgi:hypothetical protein